MEPLPPQALEERANRRIRRPLRRASDLQIKSALHPPSSPKRFTFPPEVADERSGGVSGDQRGGRGESCSLLITLHSSLPQRVGRPPRGREVWFARHMSHVTACRCRGTNEGVRGVLLVTHHSSLITASTRRATTEGAGGLVCSSLVTCHMSLPVGVGGPTRGCGVLGGLLLPPVSCLLSPVFVGGTARGARRKWQWVDTSAELFLFLELLC
jgi:hypothetical protein